MQKKRKTDFKGSEGAKLNIRAVDEGTNNRGRVLRKLQLFSVGHLVLCHKIQCTKYKNAFSDEDQDRSV